MRQGLMLGEVQLTLAAIGVGVPAPIGSKPTFDTAVESAFLQETVGSGRLQLAYDLLSRSTRL
jgi:hypothetical protein